MVGRNSPKRNWRLVAGIASLSGAALAFVFSIDMAGLAFYIKESSSVYVWLLFSVSNSIHLYAKSKTGSPAGYEHPVFRKILELAFALPYLALILSLLGLASVLQSDFFGSLLSASNSFLDSIVIIFLAASLVSGISSLKVHFSSD